MSITTPSNKLVLTTIVSILIIGGAFYYTRAAKNTENKPSYIISSGQSTTTLITENSDEWKKQFLNFLASSSAKNSSVSTSSLANDSLTSKLAISYFNNITTLKKVNNITDDKASQLSIDRLINATLEKSDKYITYDISDIKTKNDNSESSIKDYANLLAYTYEKYAGPNSDLSVLLDKTDVVNSMEPFSQIGPYISSITSTINAMLNTPVPSDLAGDHLDFINGLSFLKNVAQGFMKYDSDPAQSLTAIGNFIPAHDMIYAPLKDIKLYTIAKNISFADTEAGASFYNRN